MIKNHGHIVAIASLAGLCSSYKLSDYSASKSGLIGFMESLRDEINIDGFDGVNTTVVCPFYIDTPLVEGVKLPS